MAKVIARRLVQELRVLHELRGVDDGWELLSSAERWDRGSRGWSGQSMASHSCTMPVSMDGWTL